MLDSIKFLFEIGRLRAEMPRVVNVHWGCEEGNLAQLFTHLNGVFPTMIRMVEHAAVLGVRKPNWVFTKDYQEAKAFVWKMDEMIGMSEVRYEEMKNTLEPGPNFQETYYQWRNYVTRYRELRDQAFD